MESDLSLITKVKKEGDSNSLNELIERHSGIYLDMVNSVIPNNCDFLDKNDLLDDKEISIYKAIMNFDENKNTKFSTYLGNETKWKCLNIFNRGVKYKYLDIDNFKEDGNLSEQDSTNDISSKEVLKKIFLLADNHEDERVKNIINLRYKIGNGNKMMSWKKVAENLNISIQGCINIHDRFIEQTKKELQNVQ
jgi:DNA-directed RNA polymerase specialized sigma subunit